MGGFVAMIIILIVRLMTIIVIVIVIVIVIIIGIVIVIVVIIIIINGNPDFLGFLNVMGAITQTSFYGCHNPDFLLWVP